VIFQYSDETVGIMGHQPIQSKSQSGRQNGSQRLYLKRLNRLTYCFSKKLQNLECAFAMFACYYNWCWQTRKPGTSGKLRSTAAMMAGLAGNVWSFGELFDRVMGCTH
jgi:hypothetical protein